MNVADSLAGGIAGLSAPRPPDLEALPVAAALIDCEGALLAANATLCGLMRWSHAPLGHGWLDTLREDEREPMRAWCAHELAPGEHTCHAVRLREDATPQWIEFARRSAQAGEARLVCVRDLSAERALQTEQEALRRSLDLARGQLEQVFLAATDALLMVDCASLEILDANAAAGKLYGYLPDNLRSRTIGDLSTDRVHAANLIQTRRDRVPLRFHKRQDGSHFPVEIFARYFEHEGREVAVLAIRDITARTQQERAQLESELRHRAVFDAAPYPIFLINLQGLVAEANPCALALYGYTREEMVGLRVSRLIADEGHLQSLFQARRTFMPAATHHKRDGTAFLAETTLSFLRLHSHMLAVAVVRDVTDERNTVERLREAEERWRFALEGAGDGVWDWNLVSGEFYQSARWREMLGFPAGEEDLKWNDLLHPDDRHAVFANLDAYLRGDAALYEAEFRLRCADGTYKWIAARGKIMARDAAGRALRMLGTHRDITESRRMMETLRASEQRWQFALEGHGDGLWDWNLVTGRLTLSPQFKQILGYGVDELEGHSGWIDLVHADERRAVQDAFDRHFSGHAPLLSIETRLRHCDGVYRWVALRGKVMEYGSLNRPARMIGTLRDIDELRQREDLERRQHEQMSHAARMITIGEMASAIAHELNQPLTAIRNFSGIGLRKAGDDVPQGVRQALEIIGSESMRAGEIVRRVRNFVRKGEFNIEDVDINEVAQGMARLLEPDARKSEVMIELTLTPDLPRLRGDRIGFDQVIMNLMKNGIDAMAHTEGERRLTVHTARRADGAIECSVTDLGEGLSDKVASQLFEPFVTTKPEGMGLGLAICRTIVENHGGRLWVEPTEGRGASFHFSVPTESKVQHERE